MSDVTAAARAEQPAASVERDEVRLRQREFIVLGLCVLGFGLLAMSMGQSNNWDLRNYHWYNGWAWLSGRGDYDIAAAQAQTWFNPLLPAGLYLLLSTLKPWLGTFLLGCIQGLNIVLLHRIALRLLPADMLERRRWLALAVALVGATGATQRSELGASFGDNLVSLPLLAGIALLLGAQAKPWSRQIVAGALLGLAVGLKLTVAPIAAGIVLAAPLLARDRSEALRMLMLLALSSAAAMLAVNGFWMLHLWQQYGNPVFPLFASAFGGEFAPPGELRDTRWLPHGVLDWFAYPLVWALDPHRVSELRFLDLRVPLLFLSLLALPLWWRRCATQPAATRRLRFILAAISLAYLGWLLLFGYYRYLIVIEMLAPLLLTIALASLPLTPRRGLACIVILLGLILVTTKPARWGRTRHYAVDYVEVSLPARSGLDHATVIMADAEPLSFLAPSFPPGARFVRIAGNLMGPQTPIWAMDQRAARRIQTAHGELLLLAVSIGSADVADALSRHGLSLVADSCTPIDSNLFRNEALPQLCELRRDRVADPGLRAIAPIAAPPSSR